MMLNLQTTLILLLALFSYSFESFAQADTTLIEDAAPEIELEVGDSSVSVVNDSTQVSTSDSTQTTTTKGGAGETVTGVAVSPAHMHLRLKPGEEKEVKITITNSTDRESSFKISLADFDMNEKGKPMFLSPDSAKTRSYALSRWASVAPTFVTLKAGEKRKISIKISVPEGPEGRKAAWTVTWIEQQVPRDALDAADNGGKTVAFGVIPTYAFGVYIYQNPPNVDNNSVEINDFQYVQRDSSSLMMIKAKNAGDGIAYCVSYVDLLHVATGNKERLLVKRFTIVPTLEREFKFVLPKDLPKGEYVAIGVVDFDNAQEIQAAQTKFKID